MKDDLLDDYQQTSIRFYYNLKATRNASVIAMGIASVLLFLRLILVFRLKGILSSSAPSYGEFIWTANMVDVLEKTGAVLLLLSVIPLMMWLYRAYYNLDHVKQKGLNVTPGWAVGWFFIPFANLYYDVVILNDLFKGTKHLSVGNSPSQSMENMPVPPIALFWLLTYIVAGVLERIAVNTIYKADLESLKSGLNIAMISEALALISGGLMIYFVIWISKKQAEIMNNGITA